MGRHNTVCAFFAGGVVHHDGGPAAANPFAIPAPIPFEAPVTSATLPSKTPILFPPRLCSIAVKTLRAAPAMLAPLC